MNICLGWFLLVRGLKQLGCIFHELLSNTFNKSEDLKGKYTLLGEKEEKARLYVGDMWLTVRAPRVLLGNKSIREVQIRS